MVPHMRIPGGSPLSEPACARVTLPPRWRTDIQMSTRAKPLSICIPPGQPIGVNVHCTLHPIREQHLSSQPSQKTLKTQHPDEKHMPRLPDSIAQPITNMPLSRMENTTFAKPSIIDSHDMGLRTV
ncbi:hypothetical protein TNCV_2238641 [Trichonephila clavipes]|nr:hypothetical protein TNCV_2238641 [Trichonephila clavipes]